MKTVIADNNQQVFLEEDIERIAEDSEDYFVNEYNNKEYRWTHNEICEMYDISNAELDRIRAAYFNPSF